MDPDKLIKSHPYLYTDSDGTIREVLYAGRVDLRHGITAHHFRMRHGFVNLSDQQVADRIMRQPNIPRL